MALLVGIDEAGLGPLLGPLVVSGSVFRLEDQRRNECLWSLLQATCTNEGTRRSRKLVIADSKRLHHGGGDLSMLERAALVMLGVAGLRPASWRKLLQDVAPRCVDDLAEYAWYADDAALPVSDDLGDVATRANAVRHDCVGAGVRFCGVFSEPLWEGHFNRLVKGTRNKSAVLVGQVMRVIRRALGAYDDALVRVVADRLGGRTHYREALTVEFNPRDVQIIEESEARSAYLLTLSNRVLEVEFLTEGESHHFPIALASIFSKYIRELSMRVFNAYWSRLASDLRPTAGYYTDAQRWLTDAGPMLDRMTVNRRMLVRER